MKMKPGSTQLKTRRAFLLAAARKTVVPAMVIYTVGKTTPKLFAREPE